MWEVEGDEVVGVDDVGTVGETALELAAIEEELEASVAVAEGINLEAVSPPSTMIPPAIVVADGVSVIAVAVSVPVRTRAAETVPMSNVLSPPPASHQNRLKVSQ